MENRISKWLIYGLWLVALPVTIISCDDGFGPEMESGKRSAVSNAEILMAAQEAMDITGAGMSSQGLTYGRAAAHENGNDDKEHRLCGAVVSKNFSFDNSLPDSLIISGSITIDFGDGTNCPEAMEGKRGGKITTEFTINVNRKNHLYTSVETVTLEEFIRGSKKISGIFKARAASGGMRWLDVINAQFIHSPQNGDDDDDEGDEGEDDDDEMGSAPITWSGSLTFEYDNNGTITRDDDTKTITGSIAGETEGGSFTTEIAEAVTIRKSCFHGRNIPVSGIVNITSSEGLTVLDFGDGTCDKLYTATTNGTTEELHF